jgi:hypothetical protein
MHDVSRIALVAEAENTAEGALRAGLFQLCTDSGWPLARLTWLGGEDPLLLWNVRPGLEPLQKVWVKAGPGASWAARVAAAGRPLAFSFEMAQVPDEFAARALEAGLRYAVVFPLFEGAEVAGAVEVCCQEPCSFDGLRESLVRLGVSLGSIAERKRAAA